MKKYGAIIGIAVLMLAAIITVAGCEQSAEMDVGNWPATSLAGSPSEVRLASESATTGSPVSVTWKPADNAISYSIYYKLDEKKPIIGVSSSETYSPVSDVYSASVSFSSTGKYRVGVAAYDINEKTNGIVWSTNTVTVANP